MIEWFEGHLPEIMGLIWSSLCLASVFSAACFAVFGVMRTPPFSATLWRWAAVRSLGYAALSGIVAWRSLLRIHWSEMPLIALGAVVLLLVITLATWMLVLRFVATMRAIASHRDELLLRAAAASEADEARAAG